MSCASWMGRTLLFRVASGTKLLGVSSNHDLHCPGLLMVQYVWLPTLYIKAYNNHLELFEIFTQPSLHHPIFMTRLDWRPGQTVTDWDTPTDSVKLRLMHTVLTLLSVYLSEAGTLSLTKTRVTPLVQT